MSTGARRWTSLETVKEVAGHYGYGLLASFAAVADGRAFVTEGFEGNHTHGGLHAFDVDSGARLWGMHEEFVPCEHSGCEGDDLTIAPNHPVYARGLVWVIREGYCRATGSSGLKLVGFHPRDGEVRVALAEPATEIGDIFDAAPVFGPELIYCAGGDALHALDPDSGQLRWSRRFPAPVVATPLLAGETLHLATEGGQLHALDSVTGQPRWELTLDEPTSWTSAVPGEYDETTPPLTLAEGVLYVATDEAVLALS